MDSLLAENKWNNLISSDFTFHKQMTLFFAVLDWLGKNDQSELFAIAARINEFYGRPSWYLSLQLFFPRTEI